MTLREIYFTMVNPLAVLSRFMQSTQSALPDDEDNLDASDAAEEKTRSGIQSIEVGFRLLDVLTNEPRAMMLREIAQHHRARLDQTVGIAVWGNQGPTVVHWMESSHPAKASLKLGDVMPLLSSATGLLFAAYLPRSKTQPMLDRELAAMKQTMADVEPLLAEVREHGAARVEGMLLPTIHAFCTPVFDSTGELALGLIALGHEGTFDTRWGGEIDSALRECARGLSYELGYKAGER